MTGVPKSFNLENIASWQLDHENTIVELPALQRGFVWKVNQIEALWDSLLRGFPIGSFLASESSEGRLFLLDGQQRSTAIAIGHYSPWHEQNKSEKFWSLKNIPTLWIDLAPTEYSQSQKFVLRVVTQSHPWGYQRVNNNSILSVLDRRNALDIFKTNPINREIDGYIKLSCLNVFPYDSNLPIPLSFLIKALKQNNIAWQESLLKMCTEYLPLDSIKTKHNKDPFRSLLHDKILSMDDDAPIIYALKGLSDIEIPCITLKKEVLRADDGDNAEDPTLFVRLNSSGTRIGGDELIYSIYKAAFPESKELVENIGSATDINFISPSLVISLISRLAQSELNEGAYPHPIGITEFRKKIADPIFRSKVIELIGNKTSSPASFLFKKAFEILLSKEKYKVPPVLVKKWIRDSPEMFLVLLHWIRLNDNKSMVLNDSNIVGAYSALVWFGRDIKKYVQSIWDSIHSPGFWSKESLSKPYYNKADYLMSPLIKPSLLKEFLLKEVVEKRVHWDVLYPEPDGPITIQYRHILNKDNIGESDLNDSVKRIWENFINKLFWNKSMILFAQRQYINNRFDDFNQMETIEDTNTPWDWDHIYPSSWVYGKHSINYNTRHWTGSIGNFRAMDLETNRSENNYDPPQKRLRDLDVRDDSFVKDNDWEYWSKIYGRINDDNIDMINVHLRAIIHRMCNIYAEWYNTLNIEALFDFEQN